MPSVILADNAYGTLGVGVSTTDSSISLTAGHGVRFPYIASGQGIYACILNTNNILEEIQITAHGTSSDTVTVARAQGGTTAKVWQAGDRIECRLSSTALYDFVGRGGQATIASTSTCDIGSLAAHSILLTGTATIASFGDSMPVGSPPKIITVQSAGLPINYSATNNILSGGFGPTSAGRNYLSEAGDVLKIDCIGTASGHNVYFVDIRPINGKAYQSDQIVGARQNFEVVPHVAAPDDAVDILNCGQLILGLNGDLNQVGVRTAKTVRIENATLANVSLLSSGLGGLDTGSLAANKDYYVHAVSDGTNYSYVWSLNVNFPNNAAFPTYIYSAPVYWNHSNASGHILQIEKVNYLSMFVASGNNYPLIANGSNAGVPTPVTLTNGSTIGYVSPEAQKVYLMMEGVTGSTTVSIAGNNTNPKTQYIAQPATATPMRIHAELMLESAFIYWASTDPNGNLYLTGFEDVI